MRQMFSSKGYMKRATQDRAALFVHLHSTT